MTTSYRIPLRPDRAFQRVFVTLDGERYRFDLDFNSRLSRWVFSLATAGGTSIVRSKGLVLGADLLKRSRHNSRCPQGLLILRDLQDEGEEATIASLGRRHVLYYTPLSEVS